MNAVATVALTQQLCLGVFLSAPQVTELSRDIVCLATQCTTLVAGRGVSITAQATHSASSSFGQTRESGLMGSGGIGFTIGTQQQSNDQRDTATQAQASSVGAGANKGAGAGEDLSYANTRIEAGQRVNLQSGDDTSLRGAVVQGQQVTASVGGQLTIESLQDTSSYTERSKSTGGSVTFGPAAGASLSLSNTKINSQLASVTEQSAIQSGDGGFQVDVQGRTELIGGAITSTDKAVDEGKNRFASASQSASEALQSGALTLSDIDNRASYKASSVGVSVGAGASKGASAGVGSDKGSASSTTQAAISGIAGNQDARTGDSQTGIAPIFDQDKVTAEVGAQVQITQEFGKQASQAVGDYASGQVAKASQLSAQAAQEPDSQKKADLQAQAEAINANWGDYGTLRLAAHAVIGGLTGGVSGAAGAAAGTLTAPTVAKALSEAGVSGPVATTITAIASTAAGAAVGGTAGAATANNEVMNNYLNHNRPSMLRLSEKEKYDTAAAGCASGDKAACGTRDEFAALSVQRDRELTQACSGSTPGYCNDKKSEAIAMGNIVTTLPGGFTYANSSTSSALNTATIGAPTRPDSFHDAAAKSTSEAIVLEVGNQAAGAVIGAAIAGGKTVVGAIKGAAGETAAAGGKTSASEFIPAPNQSGQVAKDYGEFGTLGLTNVNPLTLPDGVKMVNALQNSGLSRSDAILSAEQFIASGSTAPVATPLDITNKLVKVVPAGGQPSGTTGYWITQSELIKLQQEPASMASKLGLPPGMQVNQFDVYQITPRPGAVAFESTIAPTTVNGVPNTVGGAKQTIVVDRTQFTPPVKTGSIIVK